MAVPREAFEARMRPVGHIQPHFIGRLGNPVPSAELADTLTFSAPSQIVPDRFEAAIGRDARG